jgi:hypothetical protein
MDAEEDHLSDLVKRVEDLLEQASGLRRRWESIGELLLDAGPAPERPAPVEVPTTDEADPRLLIALDMALSGRSREEADQYLRTTFGEDGVEEVLALAYERS